MRTKKIGLFSMGVSLISFGIIILLTQFDLINGYDVVIKLFPLILILLGIEVIYNSYLNDKSGDKVILKIDFFSVIFIMGILFANVVIYFLIEMGFRGYFNW